MKDALRAFWDAFEPTRALFRRKPPAPHVKVPAADRLLVMPWPVVAPFDAPIAGLKDVQAVWDAFVKPTQEDGAPPQSLEARTLMGILRAMAVGLGPWEKEGQP